MKNKTSLVKMVFKKDESRLYPMKNKTRLVKMVFKKDESRLSIRKVKSCILQPRITDRSNEFTDGASGVEMFPWLVFIWPNRNSIRKACEWHLVCLCSRHLPHSFNTLTLSMKTPHS